MFEHYQKTVLEQFVEDMYESLGILTPCQITVDELAHQLNVWIHYADVKSRALESIGGMYSMFLDSRLSPEDQRIDFLHELCHLLRHAGNQIVLPELFTKMQEAEAERFVLYAAIPFSMVSRLPIPAQYNEAVSFIAKTFKVPVELAEIRLNQIQRRELQGRFDDATKDENKLMVTEELPVDGHTVLAYYDPSGFSEIPSQIIVSVDPKTWNEDEIYISLDEPLERVELDDPSEISGALVTPYDVICRDRQIVLKLRRLFERYGLAARRFILQMRDVEDAMNLSW